VSLVQNGYVVEELSADGADRALGKRVLPGRARGCGNLGDADGLHPSAKLGAIDAVVIAEQIAGRRIIGERLDDLPCGSEGGWETRHTEVHNSAAWMEQDDEHVEHTAGRRRHHEEVDRGEIGDVVLKEGSPSLRKRLRATRHETGNGPLRDVEPELEQLAVDARRAPETISERHGADEFRKLRWHGRSIRSSALGLTGPEGAEALPVPSNHRLGAD